MKVFLYIEHFSYLIQYKMKKMVGKPIRTMQHNKIMLSIRYIKNMAERFLLYDEMTYHVTCKMSWMGGTPYTILP